MVAEGKKTRHKCDTSLFLEGASEKKQAVVIYEEKLTDAKDRQMKLDSSSSSS